MNELVNISNEMTRELQQLCINEEVEKAKLELIQERQALLKSLILKDMQSNSIKSFENEYVKVLLVEPADREYFNKNQLRKDNPDLYDEYVEMKPSTPYLKVTKK